MSKVWTVDDVLALRPCDAYTRERVMDLFAGRAALTAQDVAALAIPAEDRLWALLRMLPRERWLPAIYAAMDRAVRIYAPAALRRAGHEAEALRLEAIPTIYDVRSARVAGAAWDDAWAAWDAGAAWDAWDAGDAGDAAWVAWAAGAAGAAAWAAWVAGATAWAAETERIVAEVAATAAPAPPCATEATR
jgi:hypothetical protein